MSRLYRHCVLATLAPLLLAVSDAAAQAPARISEELRTIPTYPFSEPDPVPVLTRDRRLYPYHTFEGYSATSLPRQWKVVRLENDFIEVFVLPEVGGKVWGAVVKETGHEFIYRNEVMKFRNIALRGPWTSGGIEFNFGVIGHTPATATPVDYLLRENEDGSVSCFVGAMDLPSRTHWRVEIRLPADKAYFETNALWYNPTPLEQPYYNWMTAAAFAREDLELSIPGDAYLQHSGAVRDWPVDDAGRYLPSYRDNTFGGHKSYHVVGELNDFFGGYYRDDDYGFGHWARYEDMPGQKLWLWALSREGGVWEDLLTDTDGQYVEFQAGRLFVQYAPGDEVNPITQAGFDPLSSSRWSETWFPLEGIGGLTDASRDGALHVEREGGLLSVRAQAFRRVTDTLEVWADGALVESVPVEMPPLGRASLAVDIGGAGQFRVRLGGLELDYDSDPSARRLSRPFAAAPEAAASIPSVDRTVFEARELLKGRMYAQAGGLFDAALDAEPWNREALLGAGELAFRSGRYREGLDRVHRALQLDAYDARANFQAGTLYRAVGRIADARDAFGWAARSTGFRSAAYAQLSEMMIRGDELPEAARYARLAIEYDRHSVPGWRALAVVGRLAGNEALVREAHRELLDVDPLHHFVFAEEFLAGPDRSSDSALVASLGGEFPDQTLLELAVHYAALGRNADASALFSLPGERAPTSGPVFQAWRAYVRGDASLLVDPGDPTFRFPFRRESLPVLSWAAERNGHWIWTYLLALNLWALDRDDESVALLHGLGSEPDHAPLYAARASLPSPAGGADPTVDLRRAVALDPDRRVLHVRLVRHLQDRGLWAESLTAADAAAERFPEDFNLALLRVRTLLHLDRAMEATGVLDVIHVLPSENARDSHLLYAQAHTMAALDALDAGENEQAAAHLTAALEWPESLGQGRPYDPEERLVRFLQGRLEARRGAEDGTREAFQAVVDATPALGGPERDDAPGLSTRLDLLGVAALGALGRTADLRALAATSPPGATGIGVQAGSAGFAPLLATALLGGEAEAVGEAAAAFPDLFSDLEGGLILRALTVR